MVSINSDNACRTQTSSQKNLSINLDELPLSDKLAVTKL